MHDLGNEIVFKDGGIMQNRAADVLKKATDLLAQIEQLGIFETLGGASLPTSSAPATAARAWTALSTRLLGTSTPSLSP